MKPKSTISYEVRSPHQLVWQDFRSMECHLTFIYFVISTFLCPQALHGSEFGRTEQHHEQTPAGLAENWDASEPERLERAGTIQPLLQPTFQVIVPLSRPHTLLTKLKEAFTQKCSTKQFTQPPVLRFSACKHSKKNVGWLPWHKCLRSPFRLSVLGDRMWT